LIKTVLASLQAHRRKGDEKHHLFHRQEAYGEMDEAKETRNIESNFSLDLPGTYFVSVNIQR